MVHLTDKEKYKSLRKYCNKLFDNEKFEDSYIKLSLKILFPEIIDMSNEELDFAIDGLGSNDAGIDAFVIDEKSKCFNFLQFKTTNNSDRTTIDPKDLSYFFDLEKRLPSISEKSNTKVKEIHDIIYASKYKNFTKKFYFITSFNLPNTQSLTPYKELLNGDNYELIDLNNMYDKFKEYDSSISNDELEKCKIEFIPQTLSSEIPLYSFGMKSVGAKKTSIGIVSGLGLVKIYEKDKKKLFSRNVRFFLGDNSINKQMIKTAIEEPSKFYYFNNGISVTCTGFEKKGALALELSDPQVINGAQTISSLYKAYIRLRSKKNDLELQNHFEKIKVMVRIIETTKSEEGFSKDVTRYNNTQNKILEQDFYANDKVQKEIHNEMSKLDIFYENKRSEFTSLDPKEKKRYNKVIKLGDLTPIYNTFKNQDNSSSSKRAKLFQEDEFKSIFDEDSKFEKNIKSMIFAHNIFEITKDLRSQINNLGTDKNSKNKNEYTSDINDILTKKQVEYLSKDFNNLTDNERKYVQNVEVMKQAYVILSIISIIIEKLSINIADYYSDRLFYEQLQKKCFYNIGKIIMNNFLTRNTSIDNPIHYYKSPILIKHFKEHLEDLEVEEGLTIKEVFNLEI